MEILDLKANQQILAFSDQSIEDSSNRITKYTRQHGRNIDLRVLTSQVEPEIITTLGDLIDIRAELNISPQSSNTDLESINDSIHQATSPWSEELKKILVVTFLDKILKNMQYVPRHITETHLKNLYLELYREDISFIYLYSFREKLKKLNQLI
ncbi:MAG: hypothetical protein UR61_C0061G0005 [candidate division WS6 bacterium GW2011_GWE1_34_7]|uniref:Uncharacterized protein n=1 Tax=candidate division WS6 bacterium GW2011_GWE1_34_7 TaxID=1619093 RepID=A0A0G0DL55_9BACT|nr:MAG: hypothetical protein UR61_C0061G0005 [candidate division WS6 bacterium GW2011_GWE1_34_7]